MYNIFLFKLPLLIIVWDKIWTQISCFITSVQFIGLPRQEFLYCVVSYTLYMRVDDSWKPIPLQ